MQLPSNLCNVHDEVIFVQGSLGFAVYQLMLESFLYYSYHISGLPDIRNTTTFFWSNFHADIINIGVYNVNRSKALLLTIILTVQLNAIHIYVYSYKVTFIIKWNECNGKKIKEIPFL